MIRSTDFLELAERWVDRATEAEWRSAISRAYYAAFHEARRLLRELGFHVPKADAAHAYLSMRLSNSGVPDFQDAGYSLNSLRFERNRADYDIDRSLKQSHARVLVAAIRQTVSTLMRILSRAESQTLVDAIRNYETTVLLESTWRK
jgi:uncharacterized protein (UPF0332 family)